MIQREVAHHFGLVIVEDIAAVWHETFVKAPLLVVSVVTPLVLIRRHTPEAVVVPELVTVG